MMRTKMIADLSMILLVAGHVGCMVEEPAIGAGEDEVDRVTLAGDQSCPPSVCLVNTPYVHGLRIDDLHYYPEVLLNQRSERGFKILGFTDADRIAHHITVRGGELRAWLPGGTALGPESVVGGRIHIDWQVPYADSRSYELIITQMDYVESWTDRDSGKVPVYTIIAHDLLLTATEDQPICKTPDGATTHALLLANERYDVDASRVRDNAPVDGWFTIVCEGSALYKMRLAGYNPELPYGDPSHTTADQRQATLRMITADYCGIGHPFTVVGRELRWLNQAGWYSPDLSQNPIHEAIWGPDGALCLDNPRLEDVKVDCGLNRTIPSCDGKTMSSLGGEWETWFPPSTSTP